jgi:integrase
MAVKRAKTLTKAQFSFLLKVVQKSEHALRDEIALRLSFFAGLRAGEIANLRWENNLLGPEGEVNEVIHITSDVGKRAVERMIPMEPKLHALLARLRRQRPEDEFVFYALHNNTPPKQWIVDRKNPKGPKIQVIKKGWMPGRVEPNAVVQWFKRLYAQADYQGCTSHSGRRTFITYRARMANQNKCSIKDVQELAGHRRLDTTAEYIEPSEFQKDLVAAW